MFAKRSHTIKRTNTPPETCINYEDVEFPGEKQKTRHEWWNDINVRGENNNYSLRVTKIKTFSHIRFQFLSVIETN